MAKILPLLVSAMACAAAAQPESAAPDTTPAGVDIKVSFRPSVVIVVGIFTMIFSLTFLLLMYAKFCHPSSTPLLPTARPADGAVDQPTAGVAKPVIESLPFFRFAALRGARQGLECAVCLARFDDADLLRLLPRCRHAFHLDCVDRWLESSASCPLCRTRVDADSLGLNYAASARFVFGGGDDDPLPAAAVSSSGRDDLLQAGIFVERVPSSRFDADFDRHKHRIVVSDAVFKSRWSDLNSADLIALDTEMLRSMSSGRFPFPYPDVDGDMATLFMRDREEPPKRDREGGGMVSEMEKKRLLESSTSGRGGGCSSSEVSSGVRSMSEIVRLPRVRAAVTEEEERARTRWVPIARRTARWFATREETDVDASGV